MGCWSFVWRSSGSTYGPLGQSDRICASPKTIFCVCSPSTETPAVVCFLAIRKKSLSSSSHLAVQCSAVQCSAVSPPATLVGTSCRGKLAILGTMAIRGHYTGTHYTGTHYTALHCTALHCIGTHCTALHCTALHCTALHCTALHCTALHCTALHYIGTHYTALHTLHRDGWSLKETPRLVGAN
jgi:hypothetical protein